MKVYIVWFTQICGNDDFIEVFGTEELAKQFIEGHKTFGYEGLYYQEYDVID